jgi:outer membrane protein assembly factor BamA
LQSTYDRFRNLEVGEGLDLLVYGLEGGAVIGVGPLVVFDSRNRVLSPQKGGLLRAHYLFFGPGGLGDYSYNQWTIDGRWYLPVVHWNSVVAFQLLVEFGGDGMPFYQAPQLGGKDRLRGIGHPLRMTGPSLWMARGEFRQPLWWRLGGVVFGGAGKTAPSFSHPLNDVIGSGGCGLRFRMLPHDPLNVRVDFGVSTLGDSGFFISLKEAF